MNTLWYGDCLDVLPKIKDESVDLVYLDPPFNKQRRHNEFLRTPDGAPDRAQSIAFKDTWSYEGAAARAQDRVNTNNIDASKMLNALRDGISNKSLEAYLCIMTCALVEIHRVLKQTGSVYLHCDPTVSHYLKIMMDAVFGQDQCRNEISWRRTTGHNDTKQGRREFGNVRDVILFYTKSKDWIWNPQYLPYTQEHLNTKYKFTEVSSDGTVRRYGLADLKAAKPGGDTYYEIRVMRQMITTRMDTFIGSTWEYDFDDDYKNPKIGWEYKGIKPSDGRRIWAYSREKIRKMADDKRLYFSETGMPYRKDYLDEMHGVVLQNDWNDIPFLSQEEKTGWPTQKPISLIKRIINCSSNTGDVVLDPFCGCGTTVVAAEQLNRKWIGIDISLRACDIVRNDMLGKFCLDAEYVIKGWPNNIDDLKSMAKQEQYFGLQDWACSKIRGCLNNPKKIGDGGYDGLIWLRFGVGSHVDKALVSIKAGKNPDIDDVRAFISIIDSEKAKLGVFVCFEPTRGMIETAYKTGIAEIPGVQCPRVQIITFERLVNGEQPQLPGVIERNLY